jgi:hypothetical protein
VNEIKEPRSNFHAFMDSVIRDFWGYRPGDADPAQKAAVKACYVRFGRAARDIMAFALDDPKVARRGVNAVGARMQKAGMSWNLDTVARWFPDWMSNPEGYENETRTKL